MQKTVEGLLIYYHPDCIIACFCVGVSPCLYNFTCLNASLAQERDAMKCLEFLSSSRHLQPFQVGHLQLCLPAHQ
ncbi:hypothetical protein Hanom_Chr14g01308951 [Helianthus anomalus]